MGVDVYSSEVLQVQVSPLDGPYYTRSGYRTRGNAPKKVALAKNTYLVSRTSISWSAGRPPVSWRPVSRSRIEFSNRVSSSPFLSGMRRGGHYASIACRNVGLTSRRGPRYGWWSSLRREWLDNPREDARRFDMESVDIPRWDSTGLGGSWSSLAQRCRSGTVRPGSGASFP